MSLQEINEVTVFKAWRFGQSSITQPTGDSG